MKVAVSSTGSDLDAQVDPRFGRCAYFLIVNPDDMAFEAFENESVSLGGGAGIQSPQFVASKGATVVITGNVGALTWMIGRIHDRKLNPISGISPI